MRLSIPALLSWLSSFMSVGERERMCGRSNRNLGVKANKNIERNPGTFRFSNMFISISYLSVSSPARALFRPHYLKIVSSLLYMDVLACNLLPEQDLVATFWLVNEKSERMHLCDTPETSGFTLLLKE